VNYDLLGSERGNKAFRRWLYPVRPIVKGEAFTGENVGSIRPANGLALKFPPALIGHLAARDIQFGEPISWSMVTQISL
jgi:N-acetylneuraminate synthase